MNFNNLFNSNNSQFQENSVDKSSNANLSLYPECQNCGYNNQNKQSEQTSETNQNQAQNANLSSILQLLSLFNAKKMDMATLLASPLGKQLGINENLASMLSLLNTKNQSKALSNTQKETLPKIDSLGRLKWAKIIVYIQ